MPWSTRTALFVVPTVLHNVFLCTRQPGASSFYIAMARKAWSCADGRWCPGMHEGKAALEWGGAGVLGRPAGGGVRGELEQLKACAARGKCGNYRSWEHSLLEKSPLVPVPEGL